MTMKNRPQLLAVVASLIVCGSAGAVTLFSEDFGDGSGDLNGEEPVITTGGATWVAETGFKADGSVTGGGPGSATLAFTPVDGQIYTLDVSLGTSNYPGGPDNDWLAIGFANGQNAETNNNNRFINANVIASPWMLQRGPDGGNNTTFLGTATSGTQNGEDWTAQTGLTGGNADLRIVLDTTAGAGGWTATFFAKGTADSTYSEVRASSTLVSETITSVGIARSSADISGSVTSFTLTAVPEPSSLALVGLGGMLAVRRRRS